MTKERKIKISSWLAMAMLIWGLIGVPGISYAQETGGNPPPVTGPAAAAPGTPQAEMECTSSVAYGQTTGNGILTNVLTKITFIVERAVESLYKGITGNGTGGSSVFINAVYAAMVLYIVIYGVMFILGMANLTLGEVMVRVAKIGFILAIISGPGWEFFNTYIRGFFEQGTNDIINKMSKIMVDANPGDNRELETCLAGVQNAPADPNNPINPNPGIKCTLVGLDRALGAVFSGHMFAGMLGMVSMWPYGPVMAIMLTYGIWQFLRAIFEAVWVFLLAMIGRALLFGLAPIFISCLMFQRTKSLFDGWLNQIINFCLQPIFLFAFLGFYTQLIESSLHAILRTHWCFGEIETVGGQKIKMWRAMINGTWVRYTSDAEGVHEIDALGYRIPDTKQLSPIFPVSPIDILIFALLAQLAFRYVQVVVSIAREIAGSAVMLTNMSGALSGYFSAAENKMATETKAFFTGSTVEKGGSKIDMSGGWDAVRRSRLNPPGS